MKQFFTSKEFFSLIGYVSFGFVLYYILKNIIIHNKNKSKRQVTIKNLLIGIIKYSIIIFTILICLKVIGIDVSSFLAGLGIAGIVIGLALQDIMKDFLSGIFIIIEDQYDVGDLVEINGFVGEVIFINLRLTKLKNYEGKIMMISNRNVSQAINYSKSNSMAIIDIPVPYEANLKEIDKILSKIAKRIDKEMEVKKDTQILGIENYADSAVIYRIMTEVKPTGQYEAKRLMRKIIKEELDSNGISIPYNKLEVINDK